MSRYIDADKKVHIQIFDVEHEEYITYEHTIMECLDFYTDEGCPEVADVEEVRHGKPIVYEVHGRYVTGAAVDETKMPFLVRKEYVEKRERCPFCNATLFGEWRYYCDKCGAKMDKEKEG